MSMYERFSAVYDSLMEEIPYTDWCRYLCGLLRENHIEDGLVLELGCGTGTMTELLAEAGYDMTGIDSSFEMLQQAIEKRDASGLPILYLNQDMRAFELYGTMRAVVAVCDTMNYLTEEADFVTTLRLVNNYLDPGGLFIFDLKTEHCFQDVMGERTEVTEDDRATVIWENYYDPETRINEYALTIFEETENGLYEKSEEFHEQRAYTVPEIRRMAAEAGMEFVAAYKAFTREAPDEDAERIYMILKEKGKKETA